MSQEISHSLPGVPANIGPTQEEKIKPQEQLIASSETEASGRPTGVDRFENKIPSFSSSLIQTEKTIQELCLLAEKAKDPFDAARHYERACQLSPENGDLGLHLVRALLKASHAENQPLPKKRILEHTLVLLENPILQKDFKQESQKLWDDTSLHLLQGLIVTGEIRQSRQWVRVILKHGSEGLIEQMRALLEDANFHLQDSGMDIAVELALVLISEKRLDLARNLLDAAPASEERNRALRICDETSQPYALSFSKESNPVVHTLYQSLLGLGILASEMGHVLDRTVTAQDVLKYLNDHLQDDRIRNLLKDSDLDLSAQNQEEIKKVGLGKWVADRQTTKAEELLKQAKAMKGERARVHGEEAFRLLVLAAFFEPDSKERFLRLAHLAEEKKQWISALEFYGTLLKLNPEEEGVREKIRLMHAQATMDEDRVLEKLKAGPRAIKEKEVLAERVKRTDLLLTQATKKREERDLFKQKGQLLSQLSQAHSQLRELDEAKKQGRLAIQAYRQAIQTDLNNPDSISLYVSQALVQDQIQDYAGAIHSLQVAANLRKLTLRLNPGEGMVQSLEGLKQSRLENRVGNGSDEFLTAPLAGNFVPSEAHHFLPTDVLDALPAWSSSELQDYKKALQARIAESETELNSLSDHDATHSMALIQNLIAMEKALQHSDRVAAFEHRLDKIKAASSQPAKKIEEKPSLTPDSIRSGLEALISPLLHELLKQKGSVNYESLKGLKTFEEFVNFISTQVSVDGVSANAVIFDSYQKLVTQPKYYPLLNLLYQKLNAKCEKDSIAVESSSLEKLWFEFNKDWIEVSCKKFVEHHLSSTEGRERLRSILNDSKHYSAELRANLLEELVPMADAQGYVASHTRAIFEKQLSTYLPLDHVGDALQMLPSFLKSGISDSTMSYGLDDHVLKVATSIGQEILDLADRMDQKKSRMDESYLHHAREIVTLRSSKLRIEISPARVEQVAKLMDSSASNKGVVSQLQSRLCKLWLVVADERRWQMNQHRRGEERVKPEQRAALINALEGMIDEAGGIQSEKEYLALISKLGRLINGQAPEIGAGVNGNKADSLDDFIEGCEWIKSFVTGDKLEKLFGSVHPATAESLKDLKKIVDETEACHSMGHPIVIQPPRLRTQNTKLQEKIGNMIEGLHSAQRGLWYAYKQQGWLRRAMDRGFGGAFDVLGFDERGIAEHMWRRNTAAVAEINDRIQSLCEATSREEIETEIYKIQESLKEKGSLHLALSGVDASLFSEISGLLQTVASLILAELVTGGLAEGLVLARAGIQFARAAEVTKSFSAGVRAFKGFRAERALAKAEQAAFKEGQFASLRKFDREAHQAMKEMSRDVPFKTRSLSTSRIELGIHQAKHGFSSGVKMSLTENVMGVATGQVREEADSLLDWLQQAFATGASMFISGPFEGEVAHAVKAAKQGGKQAFRKTLVEGVFKVLSKFKELGADALKESCEEIVDQVTLQFVQGKNPTMDWDGVRGIVVMALSGKGPAESKALARLGAKGLYRAVSEKTQSGKETSTSSSSSSEETSSASSAASESTNAAHLSEESSASTSESDQAKSAIPLSKNRSALKNASVFDLTAHPANDQTLSPLSNLESLPPELPVANDMNVEILHQAAGSDYQPTRKLNAAKKSGGGKPKVGERANEGSSAFSLLTHLPLPSLFEFATTGDFTTRGVLASMLYVAAASAPQVREAAAEIRRQAENVAERMHLSMSEWVKKVQALSSAHWKTVREWSSHYQKQILATALGSTAFAAGVFFYVNSFHSQDFLHLDPHATTRILDSITNWMHAFQNHLSNAYTALKSGLNHFMTSVGNDEVGILNQDGEDLFKTGLPVFVAGSMDGSGTKSELKWEHDGVAYSENRLITQEIEESGRKIAFSIVVLKESDGGDEDLSDASLISKINGWIRDPDSLDSESAWGEDVSTLKRNLSIWTQRKSENRKITFYVDSKQGRIFQTFTNIENHEAWDPLMQPFSVFGFQEVQPASELRLRQWDSTRELKIKVGTRAARLYLDKAFGSSNLTIQFVARFQNYLNSLFNNPESTHEVHFSFARRIVDLFESHPNADELKLLVFIDTHYREIGDFICEWRVVDSNGDVLLYIPPFTLLLDLMFQLNNGDPNYRVSSSRSPVLLETGQRSDGQVFLFMSLTNSEPPSFSGLNEIYEEADRALNRLTNKFESNLGIAEEFDPLLVRLQNEISGFRQREEGKTLFVHVIGDSEDNIQVVAGFFLTQEAGLFIAKREFVLTSPAIDDSTLDPVIGSKTVYLDPSTTFQEPVLVVMLNSAQKVPTSVDTSPPSSPRPKPRGPGTTGAASIGAMMLASTLSLAGIAMGHAVQAKTASPASGTQTQTHFIGTQSPSHSAHQVAGCAVGGAIGSEGGFTSVFGILIFLAMAAGRMRKRIPGAFGNRADGAPTPPSPKSSRIIPSPDSGPVSSSGVRYLLPTSIDGNSSIGEKMNGVLGLGRNAVRLCCVSRGDNPTSPEKILHIIFPNFACLVVGVTIENGKIAHVGESGFYPQGTTTPITTKAEFAPGSTSTVRMSFDDRSIGNLDLTLAVAEIDQGRSTVTLAPLQPVFKGDLTRFVPRESDAAINPTGIIGQARLAASNKSYEGRKPRNFRVYFANGDYIQIEIYAGHGLGGNFYISRVFLKRLGADKEMNFEGYPTEVITGSKEHILNGFGYQVPIYVTPPESHTSGRLSIFTPRSPVTPPPVRLVLDPQYLADNPPPSLPPPSKKPPSGKVTTKGEGTKVVLGSHPSITDLIRDTKDPVELFTSALAGEDESWNALVNRARKEEGVLQSVIYIFQEPELVEGEEESIRAKALEMIAEIAQTNWNAFDFLTEKVGRNLALEYILQMANSDATHSTDALEILGSWMQTSADQDALSMIQALLNIASKTTGRDGRAEKAREVLQRAELSTSLIKFAKEDEAVLVSLARLYALGNKNAEFSRLELTAYKSRMDSEPKVVAALATLARVIPEGVIICSRAKTMLDAFSKSTELVDTQKAKTLSEFAASTHPDAKYAEARLLSLCQRSAGVLEVIALYESAAEPMKSWFQSRILARVEPDEKRGCDYWDDRSDQGILHQLVHTHNNPAVSRMLKIVSEEVFAEPLSVNENARKVVSLINTVKEAALIEAKARALIEIMKTCFDPSVDGDAREKSHGFLFPEGFSIWIKVMEIKTKEHLEDVKNEILKKYRHDIDYYRINFLLNGYANRCLDMMEKAKGSSDFYTLAIWNYTLVYAVLDPVRASGNEEFQNLLMKIQMKQVELIKSVPYPFFRIPLFLTLNPKAQLQRWMRFGECYWTIMDLLSGNTTRYFMGAYQVQLFKHMDQIVNPKSTTMNDLLDAIKRNDTDGIQAWYRAYSRQFGEGYDVLVNVF